jgi:hypothetical protein
MMIKKRSLTLLLILIFILTSCGNTTIMTTVCESTLADGAIIITTTIESVDHSVIRHELLTQTSLAVLGVLEGSNLEDLEVEIEAQLSDDEELIEMTNQYILVKTVQEWDENDKERPTVDELINQQSAEMGMNCGRR